jgi:alpha-mannosidase
MAKSRVLHLIGNAHLDPVWLWPWRDGCSEALTTLQSAVNFLDNEADFKFTRSSSEIYRWVQHADPRLFARIQHYVREGRWEIVGGWVEQPDCNLPSTESFVRQSLYGKGYFQREFGVDVKIGYNVDSFGHAAGLPQMLSGAGFTHYVFMRPMPWEKELPNLFWWEAPDKSRVLTWHLPQNYGQSPYADADHLEAEIRRAAEVGFAPGMANGMFFYGVGNHGGGPTRRQLERIRQLQTDPDLPELRLSTVGEFFAAVAKEPTFGEIPTLTGELNKHAPGCYAAHRAIKRDNRRVERLLVDAELAATATQLALPASEAARPLQRNWEHLAFNQFHDILGGTCTASNDRSIRDRFGAAAHPADELKTLELHRLARAVDLRGVPEGALLVWNPLPWKREAALSFDTFEAPNGGTPISQLIDPDTGRRYPIQWSPAEPCFGPMGTSWRRLNAIVPVPACGYRVFHFDRSPLKKRPARLRANYALNSTAPGITRWTTACGAKLLAAPIGFSVWDDPSDTWSHQYDGFDKRLGTPELTAGDLLVAGPHYREYRQTARWKNSQLLIHYRQWHNRPGLEIAVRVNWQEPNQILRLEIPTALSNAFSTIAGPGGPASRPTDSGEHPGGEWVAITGKLGRQQHTCMVATDGGLSYATVGGTLQIIITRSAFYAHHRPNSPADPAANPHLDQGWQEARFWLHAAPGDPATVGAHRVSAEALHPAETVQDSAHPGKLPRSASLLQLSSTAVQLIAIKLVEDGQGWIVRLQETRGRRTRCTLKSAWARLAPREWVVTLEAHAIRSFRLPRRGRARAVPLDLIERPLS